MRKDEDEKSNVPAMTYAGIDEIVVWVIVQGKPPCGTLTPQILTKTPESAG
jgi:hypothetical protein